MRNTGFQMGPIAGQGTEPGTEPAKTMRDKQES